MINLTQIILITVITILTVLLTLIGIQVFAILRDFRRMLKRFNNMIAEAEAVVTAVAHPIENIGNLLDGIQSSVKIAEWLGIIKDRTKQAMKKIPERMKDVHQNFQEARQEVDQELQDMTSEAMTSEPDVMEETRPSVAPQRPHFFHRSGTPLG